MAGARILVVEGVTAVRGHLIAGDHAVERQAAGGVGGAVIGPAVGGQRSGDRLGEDVRQRSRRAADHIIARIRARENDAARRDRAGSRVLGVERQRAVRRHLVVADQAVQRQRAGGIGGAVIGPAIGGQRSGDRFGDDIRQRSRAGASDHVIGRVRARERDAARRDRAGARIPAVEGQDAARRHLVAAYQAGQRQAAGGIGGAVIDAVVRGEDRADHPGIDHYRARAEREGIVHLRGQRAERRIDGIGAGIAARPAERGRPRPGAARAVAVHQPGDRRGENRDGAVIGHVETVRRDRQQRAIAIDEAVARIRRGGESAGAEIIEVAIIAGARQPAEIVVRIGMAEIAAGLGVDQPAAGRGGQRIGAPCIGEQPVRGERDRIPARRRQDPAIGRDRHAAMRGDGHRAAIALDGAVDRQADIAGELQPAAGELAERGDAVAARQQRRAGGAALQAIGDDVVIVLGQRPGDLEVQRAVHLYHAVQAQVLQVAQLEAAIVDGHHAQAGDMRAAAPLVEVDIAVHRHHAERAGRDAGTGDPARDRERHVSADEVAEAQAARARPEVHDEAAPDVAGGDVALTGDVDMAGIGGHVAERERARRSGDRDRPDRVDIAHGEIAGEHPGLHRAAIDRTERVGLV